MKLTLVLPALLGLAAGQVQTQCPISVSVPPSLTMQFTPRMPMQIAPTSTVYNAIMTSYLNVVDCKYVMVENVDDNPAQIGRFTARITIPVLTVYRVGCMPETTAVTRRDYRGYSPTTELPDAGIKVNMHKKREMMEASVQHQVFDIAERLAAGIDPSNDNITVREFRYLEQINTALFALNVVNSGFDLNQMCEYLRNDSIINRLDDNMIDASQASNIICFAAEYGLYFGTSNGELLADLAALEYAIQLHAYATKSLQELCEGLDYTAASFLGIDTEGIRTYICNGTAGISTTILPLFTSTASTLGTSAPSTGPTGYPSPTGTVSIIYGSNGPVVSSAASAAGTVAPWVNGTTATAMDSATVTPSAGTGHPGSPTSLRRPLFIPPQLHRHGRYRF